MINRLGHLPAGLRGQYSRKVNGNGNGNGNGNSNKRTAFAVFVQVVGVSALIITGFSLTYLVFSSDVSVKIAHEPIAIECDDDFTSDNGVTGGNGTHGDPYVIGGYEISEYYERGISILNTTAHILIKDMILQYSGMELDVYGIHLHNVTNCRIEDSTVIDNTFGILVSDCVNITIEGNRIQGNLVKGIWIMYSTDIIITRNDFGGNGIIDAAYVKKSTFSENNVTGGDMRIVYWNSENISISGNDIRLNEHSIELQGCRDSIVSGNNISQCDFGINLTMTTDTEVTGNTVDTVDGKGIHVWGGLNSHLIITNNSIKRCGDGGISIEEADDIVISDNLIENNSLIGDNTGGGIRLRGCSGVSVYRNALLNNTQTQAQDKLSENNNWDNGYPDGGNYWRDYNGTDNRSGLEQNMSGPDGIGDVPYLIDNSSQDRYPLMAVPIFFMDGNDTSNNDSAEQNVSGIEETNNTAGSMDIDMPEDSQLTARILEFGGVSLSIAALSTIFLACRVFCVSGKESL